MSAGEPSRIDPTVVAALFEEHSGELRRFLAGVLRDSQLAEDAAQSAFTKMVERGHEAREESRKAWLFRVAYHEALVLRRRAATGRNVLERVAWNIEQTAAGPEETLMLREKVAQAKAALDELPEEQRQIVHMRINEEKTFAEIADELSIPLGTALGRMRSALLKLRSRLREGGE